MGSSFEAVFQQNIESFVLKYWTGASHKVYGCYYSIKAYLALATVKSLCENGKIILLITVIKEFIIYKRRVVFKISYFFERVKLSSVIYTSVI